MLWCMLTTFKLYHYKAIQSQTYYWFLVTQCFLEARLSTMSDEELDIGMSKHLLLWQPLGQHHVVRLVRHVLRLPLPEDALLHPAEDVDQQLPLVLGHL